MPWPPAPSSKPVRRARSGRATSPAGQARARPEKVSRNSIGKTGKTKEEKPPAKQELNFTLEPKWHC
eukprot:13650563-Heterocapsa_arctica.AAC.1